MPAEAGFTLIEVLVTLALVAALSAIMMTSTFQFRHLLKAESQIEDKLALRQTAHHVAKLLEQAQGMAILDAGSGTGAQIAMDGKASEIRFIGIARRGAYLQGLREITLRFDPGKESGVVIQEMNPLRAGRLASGQPEQFELARNVTELSFNYFGIQDNNSQPDWQPTWHSPRTLPIGIAVRLSARRADTVISIEEFAALGTW